MAFEDLELVNDYRVKYVAFLDLLGFRQLVLRSVQDVIERDRVVQALKLVRDTLSEDLSIDLRFTYFSDCIVLSAEHSPRALWQIFQSIEVLTFNLLQYDILVRGGLARGPLHHSRDFVFGKAMIDAYDLERLEAHQPLVLLSNDVARETMSLGPQFAQWIREDGPDRKFVHYLMRYASYTRAPEIGKVVLTYPAKRIAHFIAKRLIHDPEKERKKAAWLQAYWNEAVALRGVIPSIDVAAAESELEGAPTILMRRLVAPLTT